MLRKQNHIFDSQKLDLNIFQRFCMLLSHTIISKLNIFIPLLDHVVAAIEDRFNEHVKKSRNNLIYYTTTYGQQKL